MHNERKSINFLHKTYGRVSKTSICVSGEKFWERKNLKKWWFLSNFVLWVKKNWILGKTVRQGCHSCTRRFERNFLSFFLSRNDDFWLIFVLSTKMFRTLPKIDGKVSETSTYVSGENFERKKMKKCWFLSNFALWVNKMDFGQNSLAWVVKAAFGVSRGIFLAFFLEKTMIVEWFLYFKRKNSGLAKNLRQGFRSFNQRLRRKCLRHKIEKIWFLSNVVLWAKKFGLCAETSKNVCQTCMLRVQRNVLRKRRLLKKE